MINAAASSPPVTSILSVSLPISPAMYQGPRPSVYAPSRGPVVEHAPAHTRVDSTIADRLSERDSLDARHHPYSHAINPPRFVVTGTTLHAADRHIHRRRQRALLRDNPAAMAAIAHASSSAPGTRVVRHVTTTIPRHPSTLSAAPMAVDAHERYTGGQQPMEYSAIAVATLLPVSVERHADAS